jgi:hypothetical protein
MNIDIPNALAMQDVVLDEPQNFVVLGRRRGGQIPEQFEDRFPVVQTSAGKLAKHKRVHDDDRSFEQVDKPWVATAKMIDPHGRVDQNQAGLPWRLRGAAFNVGCVPPNRARRLALSRSMSAFNPSLTTAVRSIGPASLMAFASNSSSILIVVRMFSPPALSIKCSII